MITYQTQTQICIIVLFWDEGLYPYICHYSKTSEMAELPFRKLTYPPEKAYLKMIFLFPRWDRLVPWRSFFSPKNPPFFSLNHQQTTNFLFPPPAPCALAKPCIFVRPCIAQLLLDLFHLWRTNPVLSSVPSLFQVIDWWNCLFFV